MGFMSIMEDKFVPVAARIGAQKHLSAVRDGFASTLPLALAGAFAVLLNNVFFVPWSLLAYFIGEDSSFIVWAYENIAPYMDLINAGSLGIMAIALAIGVSYSRATSEDVDPLATSLIGLGTVFVLGIAGGSALGLDDDGNTISVLTTYFGATGLLVALLAPLLSSEIFIFFTKRNVVITMPDGVPPAVMKAFAAVIPGFISLGAIAGIAYIFSITSYGSIFVWYNEVIADALTATAGSIFLILGLVFLQQLFWFFGLHGANMIAPIKQSIYDPLNLENIEAYQEFGRDAEGLHDWTTGSFDLYGNMGGSGATIALIAAILLFSKLKSHREIAKLSTAPGVFMINEPIMFGVPIVLNPVFLIPFILAPIVSTLIGYLFTVAGIAGPVIASVPWTTPIILNAGLATMSIGAIIAQLVGLAAAFFIYLPFVLIANSVEEA